MENNFDNMPENQDTQISGEEKTETSEVLSPDNAAETDSGADSVQYTDPNAGYTSYTDPNAGFDQNNYNFNYGNTNYQQPNQDYGNTSYQQPNQDYGNTNYQQQYQSFGNTNYQQQYQDNYNYNVGNNTGYNQNYNNDADTAPMSMGDWVITLLLMGIPCLNIIFCCVWAFGKTGNVNRRNFCRAELIFIGIGIVLSIIFTVIMAAVGFGGSRYYYY